MRHLVLHQKSLSIMIRWMNWVQKLLNDQGNNLFHSFKVTNQTIQIQTQIMIIKRGHPLFTVTHMSRAIDSM